MDDRDRFSPPDVDPLETRPSLLLRMRDPKDGEAWEDFASLYTPLVQAYCRKQGLQSADAADVTQDVLQAVVSAIRKFEYDPRRGSFRAWLHTVTRSKLNNFYVRRKRHPQGTGETAMMRLLDEQPGREEEKDWDRDYKEHVFAWAAERIRREFNESTWQAFWLTAVHNAPSKDVAARLGMSVGAVYTAKSRVLKRLAERIKETTGE